MRNKLVWVILLSVALLLAAPFAGSLAIGIGDAVRPGPLQSVFWQLRVPRVLMGFVCGALLGLCGLVSQIVFRNSLAAPDVLGISSGAAAGAVLGSRLNLPLWLLGASGGYLLGFGGALLAVLLILAIARLLRSFSIYTLLMSGVALNVFFSALVVLVQYLSDFTNSFSLLRWMMGGIAVTGYREVSVLAIVLLLWGGVIRFQENALLLLSGGDDFAAARGLAVSRFRRLLLLQLAAVNGATVAVCGPIGFVALIVPHMARLFVAGPLRMTAFCSMVLGGALLTAADLVSRLLLAPAELPVGLVTSFVGAPFFLLLLATRLRRPET